MTDEELMSMVRKLINLYRRRKGLKKITDSDLLQFMNHKEKDNLLDGRPAIERRILKIRQKRGMEES